VIADTGDNEVRVVAARTGTFYGIAMKARDIYTLAGNPVGGFSGDGGPAAAAQLSEPKTVAVDAAGNLVIADTFNNRVRVIAVRTGTFYGVAMIAGDIYTVAGSGAPFFTGGGVPATSTGMDPFSVAVDGAGNLVIADNVDNRVLAVAARTGTFYGVAMTAGDIYSVAGTGGQGFTGDGGRATAARLTSPAGVAVSHGGGLLISDGNERIRMVTG
jgi:hypothetical protein